MARCYFHADKDATHTDSILDLDNCTEHDVAYKRVPICLMCAIERRDVNTSRVEEIVREGREGL